MMTKDVDLLVCEPGLFGAWRIGHQQRGRGANGSVNGTAFSTAGADFINTGVEPGDVLYLASIDGTIDGCYEIIEVISATQLTVSMVRGNTDGAAIAVGAGSNMVWRICTFAPQRATAERMLRDRLALDEERIGALSETSARLLSAAMTAYTLVMIFEAMTQEDDDAELFAQKKAVYQQAVEAALTRLRLDDDNGCVRRGDNARTTRI